LRTFAPRSCCGLPGRSSLAEPILLHPARVFDG
jgi:hypothetical protein